MPPLWKSLFVARQKLWDVVQAPAAVVAAALVYPATASARATGSSTRSAKVPRAQLLFCGDNLRALGCAHTAFGAVEVAAPVAKRGARPLAVQRRQTPAAGSWFVGSKRGPPLPAATDAGALRTTWDPRCGPRGVAASRFWGYASSRCGAAVCGSHGVAASPQVHAPTAVATLVGDPAVASERDLLGPPLSAARPACTPSSDEPGNVRGTCGQSAMGHRELFPRQTGWNG